MKKSKIGTTERIHFLKTITELAMRLEDIGYCCFVDWRGHVDKVQIQVTKGKGGDDWQHTVVNFESYLCGELDDYQKKYWNFLTQVEPLLESGRELKDEAVKVS